jgi:hypothetical protein
MNYIRKRGYDEREKEKLIERKKRGRDKKTKFYENHRFEKKKAILSLAGFFLFSFSFELFLRLNNCNEFFWFWVFIFSILTDETLNLFRLKAKHKHDAHVLPNKTKTKKINLT